MRARALPAAIVAVVLTLIAGACGGSTERPFRIGVLTECYGPFGGFLREPSVAAAEAPLLQRGARPLGEHPSDGVGDMRVAGRRVELLQGCLSGNADVIPEARRLVEEDGADAIVGALDPQEGLVLASYAPHRPDQVFLIQPSGAPELTLSRPPPNVFRFAPDSSQTVAGLGTYAYRVLGWRNAVTVGDDNPYGYGRIGGFIAEFCALGGKVERRWLPFRGDSSTVANAVGASADGVFFGASLASADGLVQRLTRSHRDVARRFVAADDILSDTSVRRLADGVVVAGNLPQPPNRAGREFVATVLKGFPSLRASDVLTATIVPYRDGVEAVLEALQRTNGEAHGLRAALGSLVLASPFGPIHVDGDHQAVLPVYLSRIEVQHGKVRALPVSAKSTTQRFNAYFGDPTPPFTRTTPACVRQEATP